MKKARVLLADDHQLILDGMRKILEEEFEVVGVALDGRALLKEVKKLHPDVVVVDISMPLLNGIEAARKITIDHPDTKVVFLTMHPDVLYARRAFDAGASCYVLKHAAASELLIAIREALRGGTYISPSIAGPLIESYRIAGDVPRNSAGLLTSRQREVLQLLVEGHSAKEIAEILHVSSRTVEFHKYKMMDKLDLHSSAELVQFAIEHGIS